ncbi:G-type lectin S-receptor-like serine/threonine-protein kinase LECRK2 [Populus alba]|uniref:G-type lectin S-receptor-like serine/threonine-protein kinase LECRK2 n=1 Tax=Populus alba TaxID=43335 RepID=UPI00158A11EF|nr:G-type lectin S-receptor-like serine/threonine-protein kinase LECRK2 [Populus alba]
MVRLTATYLWAYLSLLQLITFLGLHHLGNLLLDSNKLVMLATNSPYGSTKYLRTIVWSANRNDLVQGGSRVQLMEDGELVLNDQSGRQIWIRPESGGSGAAYAAMLDTGNFVVASQAGANLWQSFDEPIDTLLPTQNLNSGAQLIAPYLEKNYSHGRFTFILQTDRNLLMYTTRYPTTTVNYAYWSTQDSIGSGYRVVFNLQSGYMYLVAQNGTMLNSVFSNSVSMQDFYLRATIDYDGVLRQYAYPKTASSSRRWAMAWTTNFIPSNICVVIKGPVGSGACGFNSYWMGRPNPNTRRPDPRARPEWRMTSS